MRNHNWVTDRIYLLYCDVQYKEIPEAVCSLDNPEDRLIAAEELNLAITLANRCFKPKQAAAICLLATGKASNHADAARMAGITQNQLHRATKWLRHQIDSQSA
jgi:hypothetical protein